MHRAYAVVAQRLGEYRRERLCGTAHGSTDRVVETCAISPSATANTPSPARGRTVYVPVNLPKAGNTPTSEPNQKHGILTRVRAAGSQSATDG